MKTLGGVVVIKDGELLDYPWREAIKSLLPVCDMVTVCDGESTDGTQEAIREWMKTEPKIVLCVYPWPNPKSDVYFFVNWLNYARAHTPTDTILQMDGDELLHENSYSEIESFKKKDGAFTVKMKRINYWRDTKHLIPPGVCLAHEVIRMGPQNVFLPSDGAVPEGAEWVNMQVPSSCEVHHVGFLRKKDAFFKKARALQNMFFGSYDPRLEAAEKYEGAWAEMPGVTGWENELIPFEGQVPHLIKPWLAERGFAP